MGNKLYALDLQDLGGSMSTALVDKYGEGVTIHHSDADNIVFSCPSICDKVIRVSLTEAIRSSSEMMNKLYVYYGTAWVSGNTIENSVQFCGDTSTGSNIDINGLFSSLNLILGDNFLLIEGETTGKQMALIGRLTNGQYLCIGFNFRSMDDYHGTDAYGFFTDGTTGEIKIPSLHDAFNDNGKFVAMPAIFTIGDNVIKNSDGTFATIPDLYITAYRGHLIIDTAYCTGVVWYNKSNTSLLYSSLFCPLESV